ncbi:hypothetical protein [Peribacillus kribbensis]|nr:hypothetical protein [Peribacillus kribbensis]
MNPLKRIFQNLIDDKEFNYELSMELDNTETENMGIVDHNDPEFYSKD